MPQIKRGLLLLPRLTLACLHENLWLQSDRKGSYTHLDNSFHAILRQIGEVDDDLETAGPAEAPEPVRKQPLLCFDFVEICGGAGKVSDALLNLGRSVAPVLDCPTARTMTFPVLGFASGSFT